MRIIHVVTYVSEDNAFGGPVSVAKQQAAELARRGHDISLFAAWDGRAMLALPSVKVRLFRAAKPAGFWSLLAPMLWLKFAMSLRKADAVHIHLARDLVTSPCAFIAAVARKTLIVQPHGMVMPDDRSISNVFDALMTRVILSRATVISLTSAETEGLSHVAASPLELRELPNGISPAIRQETPDRANGPVVFIARLHPRKRVDLFLDVARDFAAAGSELEFVVYGPDEGDQAAVVKAAEEIKTLKYGGPLAPSAVPGALASAAAFVLPAQGEVFPMTVLEALSAGVPVILSEDCGMAPKLASFGACIPVTRDVETIVAAVQSVTEDRDLLARLQAGAADALSNWLSIGSVADQLESLYVKE